MTLDGLRGYYVYVLLRADWETPFYIGLSRKSDRVEEHIYYAKKNKRKTHKDNIILQLLSNLTELPVVVAAAGLSKADAVCVEKYLIAFYGRAPNGPLTNLTDGGEGVIGKVPFSEDALRRISDAARRRGFSDEHRAKISAAKRGKKRDPSVSIKANETKRAHGPYEKVIASALLRRGIKASAERCEKIASALRGKKKSPAHIAAARIALLQSPKWQAYVARRHSRKGITAPRAGRGNQ